MKNLNLSMAAQNAIPSGVRKMFEKASQYRDAINLTLGEPGFVTPKHIIEEGTRNLLLGKTKYTPNAGIRDLRIALAEKLWRENGISCDPERNLIVTAGATQALMLLMVALVNPGDEVILPGPSWPDYTGQIHMVNGIPIYAAVKEEREFKMTADVIEPLITDRTKLVIINSPSNPTGSVLNRKELEAIAKMARKHQVYVISDETYERIVFDGFRQYSLAAIEGMEPYVITVNSFSKAYAMTGWRVGYICANEHIILNLIKLHENMVASINEAFQYAAVEALKHGETDVERMRQCYERNRNLMVEGLNQIRGISCLKPHGAFYVFPNVTGMGLSSEEAADLILEKTHVITAPGSAFGPGGEGFLRICYASEFDVLHEALERMKRAFGVKNCIDC